MSSRSLLIAGVIGGIVAGIALCAGVLVLIAIDGAALSGPAMSVLMLSLALIVALDAGWLTFALPRLGKLGPGSERDGGDSNGPGPEPTPPRPPDEGPSWWPEFERGFRAHLEVGDDAPVTR